MGVSWLTPMILPVGEKADVHLQQRKWCARDARHTPANADWTKRTVTAPRRLAAR